MAAVESKSAPGTYRKMNYPKSLRESENESQFEEVGCPEFEIIHRLVESMRCAPSTDHHHTPAIDLSDIPLTVFQITALFPFNVATNIVGLYVVLESYVHDAEEELQYIARYLPNLRTLVLDQQFDEDSDSNFAVVTAASLKTCANLQTLVLLHHVLLDNFATLAPCVNLLHLKSFNSSDITTFKGLEALTALLTLDLRELNQVESFEGMCAMPHLTGLALWAGEVRTLPPLALLPALQELVVSGLFLDEAPFEQCDFASTSLQQLTLRFCPNVRIVCDFGKKCPNLETIDLSGCKHLALVNVQNSLLLRSVKVAGCSSLQKLLIGNCPMLQSVQLL